MSKAYVIKNKEGKYLSIASQNYEHYWTTLDFAYYFRFLPNVDAKELADDFKNSDYPDCEVVEITIAEGDLQHQLAEKDNEIEKYKEHSYEPKREKTIDVIAEIIGDYDIHNIDAPHIYELKEQLSEKDYEIAVLNIALRNIIVETRAELRRILMAGVEPVKNTTKKEAYTVLAKLQDLYKTNTSINGYDYYNEVIQRAEQELKGE